MGLFTFCGDLNGKKIYSCILYDGRNKNDGRKGND